MYLFASARDLRRQRKNEMRRLAHNSIKPSRMAIFTVIYLFPQPLVNTRLSPVYRFITPAMK